MFQVVIEVVAIILLNSLLVKGGGPNTTYKNEMIVMFDIMIVQSSSMSPTQHKIVASQENLTN